MILEGIVTTLDSTGAVNVAPMGPVVADDFALHPRRFLLRPFRTSRTYANLKSNPCGVLHVVDDALLLAQATIGVAQPALTDAQHVHGKRLVDCCRYFEFTVERLNDSEDRTRIEAVVKGHAHVRDFFGWNRAKHAVLEAAILASRIHLLSAEHLIGEMDRLRTIVEKTTGGTDAQAFALLDQYIKQRSTGGLNATGG